MRLYCYSQAREGKEQAMLKKATTRFEKRLQELHEGLRAAHPQEVEAWKRIGRLKANSSGAGQHYHICRSGGQAGTAIKWEHARLPVPS